MVLISTYWLLAVTMTHSSAWVIQSRQYSAASLIPRFANGSITTSITDPTTSVMISTPKLSTENFITIISKKETVLPSEVQVAETKSTSQASRPISTGNAVNVTSVRSSSNDPSVTTLPEPVKSMSASNASTTCTDLSVTTPLFSFVSITTQPVPSSSNNALINPSTVRQLSGLPSANPSGIVAIIPAVPNDPLLPAAFNSSAVQATLTYISKTLSTISTSSAILNTTTDDPVVSTVTGEIFPTFLPPARSSTTTSAFPTGVSTSLRSVPSSTRAVNSDSFPLIGITTATLPPAVTSALSTATTPPSTSTVPSSIAAGNVNNGDSSDEDGYASTVFVTLTQTATMMTKMQATPTATLLTLTFASVLTTDTASLLSTITVSVPPVTEPTGPSRDPALLLIVPVTQGDGSGGGDGKVTVYVTRTVALSTVTETIYSTVTGS